MAHGAPSCLPGLLHAGKAGSQQAPYGQEQKRQKREMLSVVLQLCTWTPSDRESLRTLAFEHSCCEKRQQGWNLLGQSRGRRGKRGKERKALTQMGNHQHMQISGYPDNQNLKQGKELFGMDSRSLTFCTRGVKRSKKSKLQEHVPASTPWPAAVIHHSLSCPLFPALG